MKKKLDTTHIENELKGASVFFRDAEKRRTDQKKKTAPKVKGRNKDLDKDVSKDSSKALPKDAKKAVRKDLHLGVSQDEVEELLFRVRKEPKIRINGDLPQSWKQELDEASHLLGVGKYHLVLFAIAKLLKKV